eukprot:SAG22_NODE_440_length_10484_cov_19.751661_7_plen_78_part_00
MFDRAKALAGWLLYTRRRALNYTAADPRYGIPQGDAESDASPMLRASPPLHFYSAAAEMYRAFTEIGPVWQRVGGES